jgi:hypothetical protein
MTEVRLRLNDMEFDAEGGLIEKRFAPLNSQPTAPKGDVLETISRVAALEAAVAKLARRVAELERVRPLIASDDT